MGMIQYFLVQVSGATQNADTIFGQEKSTLSTSGPQYPPASQPSPHTCHAIVESTTTKMDESMVSWQSYTGPIQTLSLALFSDSNTCEPTRENRALVASPQQLCVQWFEPRIPTAHPTRRYYMLEFRLQLGLCEQTWDLLGDRRYKHEHSVCYHHN